MSEILKVLGVEVPKIRESDRTVSYTQYSMYTACPKHWELVYGRGIRSDPPSIYLLFGTAMHTTIQSWLEVMFAGGEFDPITAFREFLLDEFKRTVDEKGTFSSMDELSEFHDDGVEILNYLVQYIRRYYNPRRFEFIGAEIPVVYNISEDNPNLKVIQYLDLVFLEKSTGIYFIDDIKTSTSGWGTYQLADMAKMSQLVLYKSYFSKLYNIPIDRIRTRYIVLRRKLVDAPWGRDRVQEIKPIQGEPVCIDIEDKFKSFATSVYNVDGSPDLQLEYPAIQGDGGRNCNFCEFKERDDLCPKINRINTV